MLRPIALALLVASCATPSTPPDTFSFRSRDWIKPGLQDLTATVQVTRLNPELYRTRYAFDVPVDPIRGISPSAFHYIAFCVAAKLAAQSHRAYWLIGTVTPDLKYSQTKEVEFFVAIGDSPNQFPSSDAASRRIRWLTSAADTATIRPTCAAMLREELLWSETR